MGEGHGGGTQIVSIGPRGNSSHRSVFFQFLISSDSSHHFLIFLSLNFTSFPQVYFFLPMCIFFFRISEPPLLADPVEGEQMEGEGKRRSASRTCIWWGLDMITGENVYCGETRSETGMTRMFYWAEGNLRGRKMTPWANKGRWWGLKIANYLSGMLSLFTLKLPLSHHEAIRIMVPVSQIKTLQIWNGIVLRRKKHFLSRPIKNCWHIYLGVHRSPLKCRLSH